MTEEVFVCSPSVRERRFLLECPVVSNEPVAPSHYRMRLYGHEIAAAAACGQFCMLEVSKTLQPFLRRPMCFERIHPPTFDVLYKVEGEGTRLLSQFLPGQRISVQGPLGKGFPICSGVRRYILVAGGIGVAAMPALAEELVRRFAAVPEVVLAARTRDDVINEAFFRELGCHVQCATDDGSWGHRGLATDLLEQLAPGAQDCVYACGPMPMMRAVAALTASSGSTCFVSLEAQMACGDGACLGCVVQAKEEREGERMVRVCLDGPVFDARVIDWEAQHDNDAD